MEMGIIVRVVVAGDNDNTMRVLATISTVTVIVDEEK